jgi:hypothetical protein
LSVRGIFINRIEGQIVVSVSNDAQGSTIPMLTLDSNKSLLGTIKVHIINSTKLSLPRYGGKFSSNWTLAKFKSVGINRKGTAAFVSSNGVAFNGFLFQKQVHRNDNNKRRQLHTYHHLRAEKDEEEDVTDVLKSEGSELNAYDLDYDEFIEPTKDISDPSMDEGDDIILGLHRHNSSIVYNQRLVVNEISCTSIESYLKGVSEGTVNLCYVCSRNSSCSYCGGSCVDSDSVEHKKCSSNEVVEQNCCEENCGEHGTCKGSNDNQDFTCEYNCGILFVDTKYCRTFSTFGWLITVGLGFVVIFSVTTLVYYRFYKGQKMEILEELRQNLLAPRIGHRSTKLASVSQQVIITSILHILYIPIKSLSQPIVMDSCNIFHAL